MALAGGRGAGRRRGGARDVDVQFVGHACIRSLFAQCRRRAWPPCWPGSSSKENPDGDVFRMLAIVAGAAVLSWPGEAQFGALWPALAVLGACLAWGVDNNLTRKVSLVDAIWVAMVKGLAAGSMNLAIALILGAKLPSFGTLLARLCWVSFLYGISLTLFVVALRHLGTARTGAYWWRRSSAPCSRSGCLARP